MREDKGVVKRRCPLLSFPLQSWKRSPAKVKSSESEIRNLLFLVHKSTQTYNLDLIHTLVLIYTT